MSELRVGYRIQESRFSGPSVTDDELHLGFQSPGVLGNWEEVVGPVNRRLRLNQPRTQVCEIAKELRTRLVG
jgi:hypothetical protein